MIFVKNSRGGREANMTNLNLDNVFKYTGGFWRLPLSCLYTCLELLQIQFNSAYFMIPCLLTLISFVRDCLILCPCLGLCVTISRILIGRKGNIPELIQPQSFLLIATTIILDCHLPLLKFNFRPETLLRNFIFLQP